MLYTFIHSKVHVSLVEWRIITQIVFSHFHVLGSNESSICLQLAVVNYSELDICLNNQHSNLQNGLHIKAFQLLDIVYLLMVKSDLLNVPCVLDMYEEIAFLIS